jgi:hypothetical protein
MAKSKYIRTEEHKKNLSLAMKRLWQNSEYRKYMSEIHKGKIPSNAFQKGHKSWNAGLKNQNYKKRFTVFNGKFMLKSHAIWMQSNHFYRIPESFCIHHLDLNPENNSPENLVLLPHNFHTSLHHQISKILKQNI